MLLFYDLYYLINISNQIKNFNRLINRLYFHIPDVCQLSKSKMSRHCLRSIP